MLIVPLSADGGTIFPLNTACSSESAMQCDSNWTTLRLARVVAILSVDSTYTRSSIH